MVQIHNFKKSYDLGAKGEQLFLRVMWPHVRKTSGYVDDFTIVATGERLELKTEFPPEINCFIERYTKEDGCAAVDGGPWRALGDGIRFYCSFFARTGGIYLFENSVLVPNTERLILEHNLPLIPVRNDGYESQGYKIPIPWLIGSLFKKRMQIPLDDLHKLKVYFGLPIWTDFNVLKRESFETIMARQFNK